MCFKFKCDTNVIHYVKNILFYVNYFISISVPTSTPNAKKRKRAPLNGRKSKKSKRQNEMDGDDGDDSDDEDDGSDGSDDNDDGDDSQGSPSYSPNGMSQSRIINITSMNNSVVHETTGDIEMQDIRDVPLLAKKIVERAN